MVGSLQKGQLSALDTRKLRVFMDEADPDTHENEQAMNLNTLTITPFAQGIIKVDSEEGAFPGTTKTKPSMVVCARHHQAAAEGTVDAPKLAAHPIQDTLLATEANKQAGALVEIPVRMFFNRPDKSLSLQYKAYATDTGAPLCTGDGKDASRITVAGDNTQTLSSVPCPGAEACTYAQQSGVACRRQMKMTVQIDGQDDPLSVFEVRSSSLNSYRALAAQLKILHLRFGGLRHVPLKLQMWQASNTASQYEAFNLLRLCIAAPSEAEAMKQAKAAREQAAADGLVDVMDELFECATSSDPMAMFSDDFQLVSDFYGVEQPTRRRTTDNAKTVATSGKRGPAPADTAGNLIADAVRMASAARPAELESMRA
jgi:hypothetical protein